LIDRHPDAGTSSGERMTERAFKKVQELRKRFPGFRLESLALRVERPVFCVTDNTHAYR
jgi:hypothetical protein